MYVDNCCVFLKTLPVGRLKVCVLRQVELDALAKRHLQYPKFKAFSNYSTVTCMPPTASSPAGVVAADHIIHYPWYTPLQNSSFQFSQ